VLTETVKGNNSTIDIQVLQYAGTIMVAKVIAQFLPYFRHSSKIAGSSIRFLE
jgi:hypothetical protein